MSVVGLADCLSDRSDDDGGQGSGPQQSSGQYGHPGDGLQAVGVLVLLRSGLGPRVVKLMHRRLSYRGLFAAGVL